MSAKILLYSKTDSLTQNQVKSSGDYLQKKKMQTLTMALKKGNFSDFKNMTNYSRKMILSKIDCEKPCLGLKLSISPGLSKKSQWLVAGCYC
jgi:hypothetical protein